MPKMQNAQERREQEESFRKKKEHEASTSSLQRAAGRSAAAARSVSKEAAKVSRAAKALEEANAPKSTVNLYSFCDGSLYWPLGIFGLCPEQYPVANISAPAESYIMAPADRDRFLQGAPAITKTQVSTVTLTEPLTKIHTERPIEWKTKTKPTTKRTYEWSTVLKTVTMPSERTATVEEFPTVTTTLDKGTTTVWYKTTERKTSTLTNTVWHTTKVAATSTILGESMTLVSGDSDLPPAVNLSPRGVMVMVFIVGIVALFTGSFIGSSRPIAPEVVGGNDGDDDDDDGNDKDDKDVIQELIQKAKGAILHHENHYGLPETVRNGGGSDEDDSRPPAAAGPNQNFAPSFSNRRSSGATPPLPSASSNRFTTRQNKRNSSSVVNAGPVRTPFKSDDGPEASTATLIKSRKTTRPPVPLSPGSAHKKAEADTFAAYNERWAEVREGFGSDPDDDESEDFFCRLSNDFVPNEDVIKREDSFTIPESRHASVSTVQAQPETKSGAVAAAAAAAAAATPRLTGRGGPNTEAALSSPALSENNGTVFEKGPSDEVTIEIPAVGSTRPGEKDTQQGRLQQDLPRRGGNNDEIVTDDVPVGVETIALAEEVGEVAEADASDAMVPADAKIADDGSVNTKQAVENDVALDGNSVDKTVDAGSVDQLNEAVKLGGLDNASSDGRETVSNQVNDTPTIEEAKKVAPISSTDTAVEIDKAGGKNPNFLQTLTKQKLDDLMAEDGISRPDDHSVETTLGSDEIRAQSIVDKSRSDFAFDTNPESGRKPSQVSQHRQRQSDESTLLGDASPLSPGATESFPKEQVRGYSSSLLNSSPLSDTPVNSHHRLNEADSKDTSFTRGLGIDVGLQNESQSDLEPVPAQPASSPKGKEVADDYRVDASGVGKTISDRHTASVQPETIDDNARPIERYPDSGSNNSSGSRRDKPGLKVSTNADKSHPAAGAQKPLSTLTKFAQVATPSTAASTPSRTPQLDDTKIPRPTGSVLPAKSRTKFTPTRAESATSSNSAGSQGISMFGSPNKIARSCNRPDSASSQNLTEDEAGYNGEGNEGMRKDSIRKSFDDRKTKDTAPRNSSPGNGAPRPPFKV